MQGILLADISQEQSLQNQSPQSPQNSQNSAQNTSQSPQTDGIRTYQLDEVNINSVGDSVSESGISEGILNKSVASGPLDNKKVFDMPYQVNTISKEVMENHSIQAFEDAVKYFPSVQVQYHGYGGRVKPQTRGFEGTSPVGNVLWDGFYAAAAHSIPMAMFESLQIQNGLAGTLYGGQNPAGIFNFSRKRPVKDYNAVWFDFISRGNVGVGIDTSDKFEYVGYRAVLFSSNGATQPKGSMHIRKLAALGLDFYPLENLIFETNFNYYNNILQGRYDTASTSNISDTGIYDTSKPFPSVTSVQGLSIFNANNEMFMRTVTASGKFKYTPISALYIEGGYQWQRNDRNRSSQQRHTVPSAFLKAQGEFETGFVRHNVALSANGYNFLNGRDFTLASYMRNLSLLYDIALGEHFELIASGSNVWFKNGSNNHKDTGLSWAGSAIYKIIPEHLNVYFTYADSLQAGAMKYYDPTATTNNGTRVYPDTHPLLGQTIIFDPYRSYQYELGLKARVAEIDFSLAAFQITRPTYYETNVNGFAIFDEQGEQRNRGIEFTTGGKIIEPLSIYAGVTYLDAKMHKSAYSQVEGKTMINEPTVQANMLLDFAVPYTNQLSFSTNLHYTGKRWVDEMNTKAVDGYFTMDLGVRYTTKKWLGKETALRFNINNLFNERYWTAMQISGNSDDGALNTTGTRLFRGYDRTFILSGQVKF